MRNHDLAIATLACLPPRELLACVNSGGLSKSDVTAIKALRSGVGESNEQVVKLRLPAVIDAHLEAVAKRLGRDDRIWQKMAQGVYQYAKQKFTGGSVMDPVEKAIERAPDEIALLRKTVADYQQTHGVSRTTALDAVLHKLHVDEFGKLGGGRLPQPASSREIDFSSPLRGSPTYDASLDDRRSGKPRATPGSPQSGDEEQPSVDHHLQVLEELTKEGMRAGKSAAKAKLDASFHPRFTAAFREHKAKTFGA